MIVLSTENDLIHSNKLQPNTYQILKDLKIFSQIEYIDNNKIIGYTKKLICSHYVPNRIILLCSTDDESTKKNNCENEYVYHLHILSDYLFPVYSFLYNIENINELEKKIDKEIIQIEKIERGLIKSQDLDQFDKIEK